MCCGDKRFANDLLGRTTGTRLSETFQFVHWCLSLAQSSDFFLKRSGTSLEFWFSNWRLMSAFYHGSPAPAKDFGLRNMVRTSPVLVLEVQSSTFRLLISKTQAKACTLNYERPW
jgi:hypothetical protein